ncbi:MAG: VWA domain-containing protein [Lysobacteraceae bacterium]|nr:MAG: VWA domain-containing protein [Xanthomonadaceae bacterium]
MKNGFMGLALLMTAGTAQAGENASAMLVLDASGSMWGQVDGRAKIEIAREAVGTLVAQWNDATDLGLMAYGHRRKGDCADIELLRAVGRFDADAIRTRVAALQPRGMTPIGESVRQAAVALRHLERKATVILVSDGEETCSADPCAVGAELEAHGVDFTAHVIGFDLERNPKARDQLQCLARATGGRYLDARDAAELNQAMASVAAAPPLEQPTPECGKYAAGEPWMPGMSTWPTGGVADDLPKERRKSFESIELAEATQPQACRALCEGDALCSAWFFEPIGSNFRTKPVCFRWDAATALAQPSEGPEGSAMGIKAGVRQIQIEGGTSCADDPPAETASLRFNEGCTAYDQENYTGNSMQMGGESGLRVRETPERWRNGIKSLACEQGCGILVFTEPGYDGGNFSVPDGAQFPRMPDDYQRPFGSYEVGCQALPGVQP